MTLRLHAAAAARLYVAGATLHASQDKPADKPPEKLRTIAQKTEGTRKLDGFVPLYRQQSTGRLYMEIGRFGQELLYQVSLPAALGSNPVRLDRRQPGDSAIVFFESVPAATGRAPEGNRSAAHARRRAHRRTNQISATRKPLLRPLNQRATG